MGEGSRKGRLGRAAEQGTGRGGKGVEVERVVDGERGEKTRVVSDLPQYIMTDKLTEQVVERWMDRCGF